MNLSEFLNYLMVGGGSVMIVSFIVERIKGWNDLPSETKRDWSIIGSVVVALASWAVLKYVPAGILDVLEEPFMIIAGVVSIYVGGQGFHLVDRVGQSKARLD